MTHVSVEAVPVKVHVVADDTNVSADKPRDEYRVSHRTVAPTASNPIQVAGYDPARVETHINVITGPVVLCSSTSQANDAANQGTTFTTVNPNGRLLTAGNGEYVIPGPDEFWFASGVANAQVAVTLVRCI